MVDEEQVEGLETHRALETVEQRLRGFVAVRLVAKCSRIL